MIKQILQLLLHKSARSKLREKLHLSKKYRIWDKNLESIIAQRNNAIRGGAAAK